MSKFFNIQNKITVEAPHTWAWSQVSATGLPSARDGAFGFYSGGKHYLAYGWFGGSTRTNSFHSSTDGVTWAAESSLPFSSRHCAVTYIVGSDVYVVGSDTYESPLKDDSWKFNGTSWTEKSSNCGMDRALAGGVYHNGAFYIIGGLLGLNISDGLTNDVLKSIDDCASFSSIGTLPFKGGLLWGSTVSFNGKIWVITGGLTDSNLDLRNHPKEIWNSDDGVTWNYVADFPGWGRQYAQVFVWDSRIWVIGGANTFRQNGVSGDINRSDVWYSSNGTDWEELAGTLWDGRHAATVWATTDTLYMFGGSINPYSTVNGELWKLTKVYT